MSIANFGELKSAVQSWHARGDTEPTSIYTLTTAELNNRLRLVEMESETTLSATGETVALPSDFLAMIHVYIDQDRRVPLSGVTEFAKNETYRSSGEPREYTITSGNLELNPIPDGTYSLNLRYYAKMADFSADADTNAVLSKYPQLFLYGALHHVGLWAQDTEMAGFWGAKFESEMRSVSKQDRSAKMGPGPLRMRARSTP